MLVHKGNGLRGIEAIVVRGAVLVAHLRRHCEGARRTDAAIQSSVSVSHDADWIAVSRGSSQGQEKAPSALVRALRF